MPNPAVTTRPGSTSEGRNLPQLADELAHLVSSAEPAVAFTSLAALSVPAFSDECAVEILDDHRGAYRISYPSGCRAGDGEPQLRIPFEQPETTTGTCYTGSIIFTWHDRVASAAEAAIAQLMVDRVTAAIEHERLADDLRDVSREVINLRTALVSSRKIGTAMGILMASQKITSDAAFGQLLRVSQCAHRKLYEIADEVVLTGDLDSR